jgi:hypothetical protein
MEYRKVAIGDSSVTVNKTTLKKIIVYSLNLMALFKKHFVIFKTKVFVENMLQWHFKWLYRFASIIHKNVKNALSH